MPIVLPLRSVSVLMPLFEARRGACSRHGAGGDLDVEPAFQRLQPAQRHADAAVGLARGDGLEQLLGRTAEIDQLDVEIVLLEVALLLRDCDADGADGRGVPGELQRPLLRQHDRRAERGRQIAGSNFGAC